MFRLFRPSISAQEMHTAGTCPRCRGRGTHLLAVNHTVHPLPCGPCGGTGRTR